MADSFLSERNEVLTILIGQLKTIKTDYFYFEKIIVTIMKG